MFMAFGISATYLIGKINYAHTNQGLLVQQLFQKFCSFAEIEPIFGK